MDMELLVLLGGFAAVGLLGFEVVDRVDRFLDGVRRENGTEEVLWVAGPGSRSSASPGRRTPPAPPTRNFSGGCRDSGGDFVV